MGIGQVHTSTGKHVFVGPAIDVDGLLRALDDAIRLGLPLRVISHDMLALEDLRRIQAFAMGYLPVWRWLWELPSVTNRSADLLHFAPVDDEVRG